MLNERNILTRAEYQRTHGMDLYGKPVAAEHERRWTSAMVASVLGTYAYTGALVGGTLEAVSVGSHKVRRKPKEEWITLENNHAPIISREEYEKAQAVLVSRNREKCNDPQTYPLKGKIRCGNCHRAMTYISNSRGKYFYCQALKNHYYLIQIGHMISQIMEAWESVWKKVKQSRKQKHQRLLEDFKRIRLREILKEERIQIRLQ